jgi:hypothetical protein
VPTARRFPPPWSVEKQSACFVVMDSTGQKLAYVYFEDEPGRRSAAKLLSKDDARRMGRISPSCRSVGQGSKLRTGPPPSLVHIANILQMAQTRTISTAKHCRDRKDAHG